MRIDADVLNTVIPRFLKDGWQVVRVLAPRGCHAH